MNDLKLLKTAEYITKEKDWRKVRGFLGEVEDTAEEMTSEELEYFLDVCYELMLHSRSQIRRIVGETAAVLLSRLDESFSEIWEAMLRKILFPNLKLEERQARSLAYCLKQLMTETPDLLEDEKRKTFFRIYAAYFRSIHWREGTCIRLLAGILEVPEKDWTPLQKHEMFGFMRQYMNSEHENIILLAMLVMKNWLDTGWKPQEDELRYLQNYELSGDASYAQQYMMMLLSGKKEADIPEEKRVSTSQLIQQNMRLEEAWAQKLVRLHILRERGNLELYANHLQNLMNLNSHPMVFLKVRDYLMEVMPHLQGEQVYEVVHEVLKELSMGVDTANYAASFLGNNFYYLTEDEQTEFVELINDILKGSDPLIVMSAMEIISCILSNGDTEEKKQAAVKLNLPGLLAKNCCSHDEEIAEEAKFLISYYEIEDVLEPYGVKTAPFKYEGASENPLAFFNASFDPFTTRDKAIVEAIVERGFDICLGISDFEWSKHLQPMRIRRRLLKLAASDLTCVELLPEDISINTGNDADLEKLKSLYPDREIWLVEENTQIESVSDAGAKLPHIIYSDYEAQGLIDREAIGQIIHGEVIFLPLPAIYQGITSAELHSRIRSGRNIRGFLDPYAERMVIDWKLFADRARFKELATQKKLEVVFFDGTNAGTQNEITVKGFEEGRSCSAVLKWRKAGRTAVVESVYGSVTEERDYRDLALMELLAKCQEENYHHVVCFDAAKYRTLLEPYGFLPMEEYEDGMTVNLSQVIVIFLDAPSNLREPFNHNPRVLKIIRENQNRLRRGVASLYPGKLVLGLSTDILNDKMIHLIQESCDEDSLCALFGKNLKGVLVPEVITSDLNMEKRYSKDMTEFGIYELPGYPSLGAQLATLKSMDKEILLSDDIYHKGYRVSKLMNVMQEQDLKLEHLAVGVLSGNGEKLAKERGIDIKAVYRVPNMYVWLLESDFYPFVGGDGIESDSEKAEKFAALHSVNPIMPYDIPSFLCLSDVKKLYGLSEVCLENARRMFEILEDCYYAESTRTLTVEHLQEVMVEPRYPIGSINDTTNHRKISEILEGEHLKLMRLKTK